MSAGARTPTRTLIGGVGYPDLRDFSLGPLVAERLAGEPWPPEVSVENLSYNPVAVVHRLQEADPPFGRLVLVGAVRRGRRPGCLVAYRWDRALPGAEEVQERVAEAVTGVISLDNLVLVTAALGAAPEEVVVVEVEPEVEAAGDELTEAVRRAAERAGDLVRSLAAAASGATGLPAAGLGGFAVAETPAGASAEPTLPPPAP